MERGPKGWGRRALAPPATANWGLLREVFPDAVLQNFDEMSGVSFLPHSDHSYQQAPYQDCNKKDYEILKSIMPNKIDWSELSAFEAEDTTKSSQTFACTGEVCEMVDITA